MFRVLYNVYYVCYEIELNFNNSLKLQFIYIYIFIFIFKFMCTEIRKQSSPIHNTCRCSQYTEDSSKTEKLPTKVILKEVCLSAHNYQFYSTFEKLYIYAGICKYKNISRIANTRNNINHRHILCIALLCWLQLSLTTVVCY